MKDSYYEGRVAVVTGAGGTLCSEIAVDLAQKGARVVLVGRTREKLERTAQRIAADGGAGWVYPCDVTDEAAVRAMAAEVAAQWGSCRFLVNGAGGNRI